MIIGNDSRPFGFDISRHAYSLVMPSNPRQTEHAVLHNLNPLRAVGIDTRNEATVVKASADELGQAAEIAARIPGDGRLWIMHPGAGKTDNLWPTDRFAAIAGRVLDAGHRLLVLQGPADGGIMGWTTGIHGGC
jgi:ADP-heptose:LPS heptosyltransferase